MRIRPRSPHEGLTSPRRQPPTRKLNVHKKLDLPMKQHCDPNGIRTRVTAVKGRCPGPLDDRVKKPSNIGIAMLQRKANRG
jgi:hypothetical protein